MKALTPIFYLFIFFKVGICVGWESRVTRWCHYLCEADFGQAVWKGQPGFGSPRAVVPCRGDVDGSGGHCAWLQQSLPQHPPELTNSLAGSRAAAQGAEQGPGPGVWEGDLVPAEQGTGTALPCSLTPICSCRGSTAAWEPLGSSRAESWNGQHTIQPLGLLIQGLKSASFQSIAICLHCQELI